MRQICFAIAGAAVLAGCKSRTMNEASLRAGIHGADDRIEINEKADNIPQRYSSLVDAIGVFGDNCTVTHVGNGVAITAGHCLSRSATALGKHPCGNISIRWGERQSTKPSLESKCISVLAERTTNDVDYAFVTVDPIPKVSVELNVDGRAPDGASISFIGYPGDGKAFWTTECEKLPKDSSHIPGANKFKYQCDSDGGMSGAALIESTSMKIIGIHNGGNSAWSFGSNLLDTPILEALKN